MAQLHPRRGDGAPNQHARAARLRTAMVSWLTIGATTLTVACGERASDARAGIDSALNRDLTLAASATPDAVIGDTAVSGPAAPLPVPVSTPEPSPAPPPAQRPAQRPAPSPAPSPAPAARTPRASTPTPAPTPVPAPVPAPATTEPTPGAAATAADAPAAGTRRAIGAGTVLSGPTNTDICAIAQRPGDRFVISLAAAVAGADGATLPAGTPVLVELARADSTTGEFTFRLRGVQVDGTFLPAEGSVRVSDATVTERKVSKGGSDQGKVVTGAIIGGILGRVLGGGAKGAVIGAAGGAAAGTVAAARNTTIERCLAAGATVSATLTAPLLLP